MTWVQLDDRFFMHPKVMACGPAAAWLWVASIGYANANLTDGFVPTAAVMMLAHDAPKRANELAAKLVAARLWEPCEGGFRIHDYLDWNQSAAAIREHRAKLSKTRSEAGRSGGLRSGEARAAAKSKQVASDLLKQNEALLPLLSKEDPHTPAPAAGAPPATPVVVAQAEDPPRAPRPTPARQVFEHWQRVMGSPRSVLDGKRERIIRAAIDRHGIEECLRAVDGCAADPWSMGENDRGTKFNSLELILRDAAHVEKFAAIVRDAEARAAAVAGEKAREVAAHEAREKQGWRGLDPRFLAVVGGKQ